MSQICTLFKNEFDKAAKELNVAPVIVNTIYELVLKDLNPTLSDNVKLPTKQQFIDSINKYYNFNTITFEEELSPGYRERTIKNASADATIALAIDFNSAGEKLTKKTVNAQNKKYIPIDANSLEITQERVNKLISNLNSLKINTPGNSISLNIAGNGIYTMNGKYTQEQVDEFTYELLKAVTESPNLKVNISSIRSGGQTGFDEAGIKAAQRLGISSKILAPKGWKFRDISGTDITDENQFKSRFLNITKELEVKPTISKESLPDEMFKADEKQVTFESKNLTLDEQEVASKRNSIAKKLFNRFKSTFELKREKIKTVFTVQESNDIADLVSSYINDLLIDNIDSFKAQNNNNLLTTNDLLNAFLREVDLKTLITGILYNNETKDFISPVAKKIITHYDLISEAILAKLSKNYGININNNKSSTLIFEPTSLDDNSEAVNSVELELGSFNALNIVSSLNVSSMHTMSRKMKIMLSKVVDIDISKSSKENPRIAKIDTIGKSQKVNMKIAYNTLMEMFSSNQSRKAVAAVGINNSSDVLKVLIANIPNKPWLLSLIDEFQVSPHAKIVINKLNEFLFDNVTDRNNVSYSKTSEDFVKSFTSYYNSTREKNTLKLDEVYPLIVNELPAANNLASILFTGFYRMRNTYTAFKGNHMKYLNKTNSAAKFRDILRNNIKSGNVFILQKLTSNPENNYNLANIPLTSEDNIPLSKEITGNHFSATLTNIRRETEYVRNLYSEKLKEEQLDSHYYNQLYNVFNMWGINLPKEKFIELVHLDRLVEGNQIKNILNLLHTSNANYTDMNKFLSDHYTMYHGIGANLLAIYSNEVEESFYYNNDSYYSMSLPNVTTKLIRKLKSSTQFTEVMNTLKQDVFLFNKKTNSWYSRWLEHLDNDTLDIFIQLDHQDIEYGNFSPKMYLSSAIENFYEYQTQFAKENIYGSTVYVGPITGDSQVHMLYKAPLYKVNSASYDSGSIYYAIAEQVLYEARRIATLKKAIKVTEDAKKELDNPNTNNTRKSELKTLIKNNERILKYTAGELSDGTLVKKNTAVSSTMLNFHLFPQLNNYETAVMKIITNPDYSKDEKISNLIDLLTNIDSKGTDLFESVVNNLKEDLEKEEIVRKYINSKQEILYRSDVNALQGLNEEEYYDKVRAFALNHFYAHSQIHLIFNNDVSQFKSIEDAQKRTKQVSSPGEYYDVNTWFREMGRKVINYVFVSDKIKPSNVIQEITNFVNQNENFTEEEKADIIDKYNHINTTDGASYITLKARVAKIKALNLWSDEYDYAYNRIKNKTFTKADLDLMGQEPDKPHVFSKVLRKLDTGQLDEDGNPITIDFLTGVQIKNSEYVIYPVAIDSKNNPLAGSYETSMAKYMEDNNIDVLAFNSSVKVGLMNNLGYNEFKNLVDKNIKFDPAYINGINFEDVKRQQDIADHFTDAVANMGVQLRKIVMTNLPDVLTITNGRSITAELVKEQYLKTYKELFDALYEKGYDQVAKLLDSKNRPELIKKIRNVVNSSEKYSSEINTLLDLMEEKGDNLVLYDPMFTNTFQKVILNYIKKEIIKLELPGGQLVQVSMSSSDDLKIEFNKDDKGNIISINHVPVIMPWAMKESFEDFIDSDGYIDVEKMERKAPELLQVIGYRIPTEGHYSIFPLRIIKFSDKSAGNTVVLPNDLIVMAGFDFDIDKLFIILPEVRRGKHLNVTKFKDHVYDLYSKGQLGTEFNRSVSNLRSKTSINEQGLKTTVYERIDKSNPESYATETYTLPTNLSKNKFFQYIDMTSLMDELSAKREFTDDSLEMKLYDIYTEDKDTFTDDTLYKVPYDINNVKSNSKAGLNNMFFDMAYAALTAPKALEQQLSPGQFDNFKKVKRIIEAKRLEPNKTLSDLDKLSIDELTNEINKSTKKPTSICDITVTKDIHKKNAIAAQAIGVCANQVTNHPVANLINLKTITPVSVMRGVGVHDISTEAVQKENKNITSKDIRSKMLYISKRLASSVNASVDAVKDPVLDGLNINMFTIDVTMLLLRGSIDGRSMSDLQLGVFLNQPVIQLISNTFQNNSSSKTRIIKGLLSELSRLYPEEYKTINESFSKEDYLTGAELEEALKIDYRNLFDKTKVSKDQFKTQIKVLLKYAQLFDYATALSSFTNKMKVDTNQGNLASSIYESNEQLRSIDKALSKINFGNENKKDAVFTATDFLSEEGDANTNVPIVRSALNFGMIKPLELLNELFPYNSPMYVQAVDKLIKHSNYSAINPKLVNKFLNSLTSYLLMDNKYINEKYIQNGQYEVFMNSFPIIVQEFRNNPKLSKKIKNMSLLDHISTQTLYGSNFLIVGLNTRGVLETEIQDQIRNSWKELYNEFPEFAEALFVYELFRNGLQFNGTSFGNLAPVEMINTIPDYYSNMSRLLDQVNTTEADYSNILDTYTTQFIKNNLHRLSGFMDIDSPNLKINGKEAYVNITTDEEIPKLFYTLEKNEESNIETIKYYMYQNTDEEYRRLNYHQIEPFGIGSSLSEYDYSRNLNLLDLMDRKSIYNGYKTSISNPQNFDTENIFSDLVNDFESIPTNIEEEGLSNDKPITPLDEVTSEPVEDAEGKKACKIHEI